MIFSQDPDHFQWNASTYEDSQASSLEIRGEVVRRAARVTLSTAFHRH